MIKEDPDLSFAGRKKILRSVGEAIQELHDRNWVHIGACLIIYERRMYPLDIHWLEQT